MLCSHRDKKAGGYLGAPGVTEGPRASSRRAAPRPLQQGAPVLFSVTGRPGKDKAAWSSEEVLGALASVRSQLCFQIHHGVP